MANDPLDTLATGYAADRVRGILRAALWGYHNRRPDEPNDADVLARVATETLRGDPAALLAFAAEITASLSASGMNPTYPRAGEPVVEDCSWCGRLTLVSRIGGVRGDTGYRACGSCIATARVYQPPPAAEGPWPPDLIP